MNKKKGSTRLLAINFGGLGDEVLFLPTLHSIKLQHPDWQITLLTEPRSASIKQVTNLIDEGITFDIKKRPLKPKDLLKLISLLRAGRYDVVLSSGSSPQVSMLLFLSGIPERIGYGSNVLARILLTAPVPLKKDQHAVLMYHDLAKGLGIEAEARRPEVIVKDASLTKMAKLLADSGFIPSDSTTYGATTNPIVIIHPGTSQLALEKGIIKVWAPEQWAQLIPMLIKQKHVRVILAGGPDDAEAIQQIQTHLQLDQQIESSFLNAFGKTASLADLVALIELSDLLICVDSAPMHLAVGRNKPLVALFGPTDPAKLLWPDKARFKALRDQQAAALWANKDPFAQPANRRQTQIAEGVQLQRLCVQIPLDTVFQTASDLLNSDVCQGSSRESH